MKVFQVGFLSGCSKPMSVTPWPVKIFTKYSSPPSQLVESCRNCGGICKQEAKYEVKVVFCLEVKSHQPHLSHLKSNPPILIKMAATSPPPQLSKS